MSATLLEQLKANEVEAAETAHERYSNLVAQLACGTEDPTLTDVQSILSDVGKSATDLTCDVHTRQERDSLRAKIAEAAVAKNERADLEAAIAQADAELERAVEKRKRIVQPLYNRLSDITQLANEATGARQRLLHSGYDPALDMREQANRQQIAAVEARLREQRKQRGLIEANIRNLKSKAQLDAEDARVVAFKESNLAKACAEIADLEIQRSELIAESDEIVELKVEA